MNTATILLRTLVANPPSRQEGSPQLTPDGAGVTPLENTGGTSDASVFSFGQQLFNLCNPAAQATPPIPTAGEARPEQPAPIEPGLDIDWQATVMLDDAAITIAPLPTSGGPRTQQTAPTSGMPFAIQTATALNMPPKSGGKQGSAPSPSTPTPLANPALKGLFQAIVPQTVNAGPAPAPAPLSSASAPMPLPAALMAAIVAQVPAANGQKDGNATTSPPASLANGTPAIEISPFSASPAGNSLGQTLGQMTSGTTTAAEPATVDANRLLEQFDQLVLRTLRTDNKTLRVELHPASMGRMVLQCRETTSGLSIQLNVQNSDIRSLLTNEEHSLRSALQNKGIQVGQFSVSTQDRQDSASGNPSDRQHAPLPQPTRTMNFPGATPAAAPATAAHHYRQRYSRWVA